MKLSGTSGPADTHRKSPVSGHFLITGGLLLGAALLRFLDLEGGSLWNDELFSFNVADLPSSAIGPELIAHYHHPPLFFYLLHLVLRLFGHHAWALRLISALCGSLTVGLVYVGGRKFFNGRSALIAALICLLSPFHLAYSQEGRPYALAALLALMSLYSLMSLLGDGRPRWKLLYVLSTLALLSTHHWGLFFLASEMILIMFFAHADSGVKRSFVFLWVLVGLLYLPEASALVSQSAVRDGPGWFWAERASVAEVVKLILAFSGSYFKMASSVFDSPFTVKAIGGLAVAVLLSGLAVAAARSAANLYLRAVLLTLGFTLAIPFAISFIRPEIFLWYRYTVIVFPVFSLALAAADLTGRLKPVNAAALSLIVLIGVYGTLRYQSWQKSNVKDVARYVESVTRDDVKIIIRPAYFAPLLDYYYRGDAAELDEAYLDSPLGSVVDTARSFVYVSLDVPNEIRTYMDAHFEKSASRVFPGEAHMGMVVSVYRQPPGAGE